MFNIFLPEWIDNVDDNCWRFSVAIVLSSALLSIPLTNTATLPIFSNNLEKMMMMMLTMTMFLSSHLLLQCLRRARLRRFWPFE